MNLDNSQVRCWSLSVLLCCAACHEHRSSVTVRPCLYQPAWSYCQTALEQARYCWPSDWTVLQFLSCDQSTCAAGPVDGTTKAPGEFVTTPAVSEQFAGVTFTEGMLSTRIALMPMFVSEHLLSNLGAAIEGDVSHSTIQ
jgi:hypothetical protein